MIYSVTLHIVDIFGILLAVFLLGLMVGHKYLPKPIDMKKEDLIARLFNENIKLRVKRLSGLK